MDDGIKYDAAIYVPVYLRLCLDQKLSAEDAARHIHFYTSRHPEARSLVPSGSTVDLELQALERRDSKLGFDLYRIDRIDFSIVMGCEGAWEVRIDSDGGVTVENEQRVHATTDRVSVGLSHFGITLRGVEGFIASGLPSEYIDPSPDGDLTDFRMSIRAGGKDFLLCRWVYGTQSLRCPQPIIEMVKLARTLLELSKSKRDD